MEYRSVGNSGLKISALSLGFWHNFGQAADYSEMKGMVYSAFDGGINSFDLANNYGPPVGEAERNFARIMADGFSSHRDEIVISTKAGHDSWQGPFGTGGTKKHLLSSLDQSLKRLKLSYVDIFYHHVPDPSTPMEATAEALAYIVNSGRALYVGLSKYSAKQADEMVRLLAAYNIHPVMDQVRYSLLNRTANDDNLFIKLEQLKMGAAVFSPLAQGLLTDKYLSGDFPINSRAHENHFLKEKDITQGLIARLEELRKIANARGQKLSEMALSFVLNERSVSTVIIGARNKEQVEENIRVFETDISFTKAEIDEILSFA